MEYFILVSLGPEDFCYIVVVLNIKSDSLQWNTVFNESVGKRSKSAEVKVGNFRRSRRGDGCNTFLLTGIGMNACSEQRPRIDA